MAMAEQCGYAGKILKVDLTNGQVSEIPSGRYLPKYFGGRGLAAKLYWDEVTPEAGALEPENGLIFTTGPLTGTGAAMTSVGMCAGKAPMIYPTPTYFCSSAAGAWAHEMKYSGYDAFIIKGKASQPVYLYVEDGHVEIKSADFLWGHTTRETRQELMNLHGDRVQVACIGPAGENLVIPSIISVDCNTAFGAGGFGAVMGSKNLKAVAVRGTGSIRVANPNRIIELNEIMRKLISIRNGEQRVLANGKEVVGKWYDPTTTMYFPIPGTETAFEKEQGSVRIRRSACPGCFVMCKSKRQYIDGSVPDGSAECQDILLWIGQEHQYYGGRLSGRLNWEASMLVDDLGLDNFHTACQSYGLVTGSGFPVPWSNVSPGASCMALDMWWEANRRGILTEENTGLPWSRFGSKEFMEKYVNMLAYRQGFGDILANGSGPAVTHIMGNEAFGPNRNDMEFLYQKSYPKAGVFGGTLRHCLMGGYALGSARPTCSLYSAVNSKRGKEVHADFHTEPKDWLMKFYGVEKIPNDWGDDLAKVIVVHEYYANQADSAPVCAPTSEIGNIQARLAFNKINDVGDFLKKSMNGTAEYLSAVFGKEITQEELFARDEMLVNLERAIWIRDGYTKGAVDTFFDCIFEETDSEGNILIPRDKFENALGVYYQLRGWKEGVPTKAKLEELDLKYVADELKISA